MATSWVKACLEPRRTRRITEVSESGFSPCPTCAQWLLLFQVERPDGQIPMCVQNLKPTLLCALIGRLIGKELFLQSIYLKRFVGHSGILDHDGHAVVPTPVFGRVIARLVHPHLDHASHLDFFLKQGIVVLLER